MTILTCQDALDGKIGEQMDALPLDPGDYSGSYKLLGGRLALDFVNTVSWPDTKREHDWLSSAANATAWCAAVGLAMSPLSENDLDAFRALRRDIRDTLRPFAHDQKPPKRVVEVFNSRVRSASHLREIDPETLAWVWTSQSTVIDWSAPIVFDAAEIVTLEDHARLKHCPSCDWLFEDQTRNGSRRWCDMSDCGSRAKSRDYYRRTKVG